MLIFGGVFSGLKSHTKQTRFLPEKIHLEALPETHLKECTLKTGVHCTPQKLRFLKPKMKVETMTDPWQMVYLPTWMVDFYGFSCRQIYHFHGSVMGMKVWKYESPKIRVKISGVPNSPNIRGSDVMDPDTLMRAWRNRVGLKWWKVLVGAKNNWSWSRSNWAGCCFHTPFENFHPDPWGMIQFDFDIWFNHQLVSVFGVYPPWKQTYPTLIKGKLFSKFKNALLGDMLVSWSVHYLFEHLSWFQLLVVFVLSWSTPISSYIYTYLIFLLCV